MKSLQDSSGEGRLFLEGSDRWMGIKFVTEIEKVRSIVTEKTKSLKLPERLRNLRITYSDAGHAGRTTREDEESR
jgi:hypothetical protein